LSLILTVALVLTVGGFLFTMDRKDRRHAAQLSELYQRIQAPEIAAVQHWHGQAPQEQPAHLPFDDDAAWIEYQNGMAAS
jgi:hypothetical protein